jgi:hypothetical protein
VTTKLNILISEELAFVKRSDEFEVLKTPREWNSSPVLLSEGVREKKLLRWFEKLVGMERQRARRTAGVSTIDPAEDFVDHAN